MINVEKNRVKYDTKTWSCKQCEAVFNYMELGKRTHPFGRHTITELACPHCGSTSVTCISLPWRLDYIDDVDHTEVDY